ncbi:MAG: hypothetical protein WCL70_02940 [Paludibacter sp.]
MRITLLLFSILFAAFANAQVLLLQENFQDWKPEAGIAPVPPSKSATGVEYSFTKKLPDGKTQGTFTSNELVVQPEQSIGTPGRADGNGKPTNGRVIIKGTKNYLQLPLLPNVGKIIIKASAGTDQKEFKIQASIDGKNFEDVANTVTPCEKAVTKEFTFNLSLANPNVLRILPNSSSAINIWDIEIYSFSKK